MNPNRIITAVNHKTGHKINGTATFLSCEIRRRGWTDWDICELGGRATVSLPPARPQLALPRFRGTDARDRKREMRREAVRLHAAGETISEISIRTGLSPDSVEQVVRKTGMYRKVVL